MKNCSDCISLHQVQGVRYTGTQAGIPWEWPVSPPRVRPLPQPSWAHEPTWLLLWAPGVGSTSARCPSCPSCGAVRCFPPPACEDFSEWVTAAGAARAALLAPSFAPLPTKRQNCHLTAIQPREDGRLANLTRFSVHWMFPSSPVADTPAKET